MIRPAAYGETLENGKVACHLCPAECRLNEGKAGICGCRLNKGGELVTENYGELVTIGVDPIEKKPLYHFYPAKDILSTGANGCNFGCLHCQNWAISQKKVPTRQCTPEQLVETASESGSIGVAFTYTEPMIWYEYIMDCAPLLRKAGLKVVLVSNGYINADPLKTLLPVIDAVNVDLKGMRAEFYRTVCKGKLEPILNNIRTIAQSDVHLEVTNLIIPEKNDSDEDINKLVDYLASVSVMIPLHLSAYRPDYKMKTEATTTQTLLRARQIAAARLKYVYLGNVHLSEGSDTHCPQCAGLLIRRNGYVAVVEGLEEGNCRQCGFVTGIIQ